MIGEIEIVEWLRRRTRGERTYEGLGIGDDCAIYRPRRGEELLFTTDMLLEDVHFRMRTHPPRDAGRKALARALSDIAAMGGEARFCLLSLAAGRGVNSAWLKNFLNGFLAMARESHTPLVGGDLARANRTACDVVVCGSVPLGRALTRSGARSGDALYVSGRLGASALGLRTRRGLAWRRHLRPEPRLRLGLFLREEVRATACMDLSDGLSLDLRRMCLASGLSADIQSPPRVRGATLDEALHGGEDYELLFTAAARRRVPSEFEGIPLTRIGTMRQGRPGRVRLNGLPLAPLGFDHFRRS